MALSARYPSLQKTVVLITGGATGIGAAMVEQFALQGAQVAFVDIDEKSAAQLIENLVPSVANRPAFWKCDLTEIPELRLAIEAIEAELGPIRVLVNNAASDDRHKFPEVTPEYWDERMNVNLRHHFFAIQAVAPGMKRAGGGSIINMSSISWMIPSTGLPAYITAKAGIVGLTRTLARELGGANIRVNCISPGAIMITPDDVAKMVLFLASEESSAITGQNFVVDGGWV
ncbi:MAG: 3-oxoacyl-ACP reductase [Acidobacteria bacterium]|nr:MAG: 3-oxoacyl-ACP reductase [Acidobacteriota bacterium]